MKQGIMINSEKNKLEREGERGRERERGGEGEREGQKGLGRARLIEKEGTERERKEKRHEEH